MRRPLLSITSLAYVARRQCSSGQGSKGGCPFAGEIPAQACPVENTDIHPKMDARTIVSQLGKAKLSAFVTSTACVGYVLCHGSNPLIASAITLGTFLQSLSANGANQIIEVENDRMMKRTARRPLVIGAISPQGAAMLLLAQLGAGTALLYTLSPTAAALGVANWCMYVCVYTPLKRISTTNTWWGAIVGAVPPLMGGVTAVGSLTSPAMAPAVLLAGVLFVWQIPHFMSLAFHCRRDYEEAGFKMLPFHHPKRASTYAVALSVIMAGLTVPGPLFVGPVEPWFFVCSSMANALMIFKAYRFHVDPVKYCRTCFVYSYMYLAIILVLLWLNHLQPIGQLSKMLQRMGQVQEEKELE